MSRNYMIKDERVHEDITAAMSVLGALKYVYERDGFIALSYMEEKLRTVKSVIRFLDSFSKVQNQERSEEDGI